jgi:hypothetical protein
MLARIDAVELFKCGFELGMAGITLSISFL